MLFGKDTYNSMEIYVLLMQAILVDQLVRQVLRLFSNTILKMYAKKTCIYN